MSGSSFTEPKGRATRAQNEAAAGSGMNSTLQWALVILAGLVIIGVIFYLGRDVRSDLGADGPSGAPAVVPAVMADPFGI